MHRRTAESRILQGCSALDGGVDLIDQLAAVGELVVLGEVALGILTRLAVQRHVQRHEPGAVEVAALACSCRASCCRTR